MVKNLSAHQTQARVHKWKWGGFGNLRYCCELVLPKMMHLLNHKQKQLRWGVDYYEEMLPNGREKHGCRGRLICISISGTLGCPGRAAGLGFVKHPSWRLLGRILRKPLERSAQGIPASQSGERKADHVFMAQPGSKSLWEGWKA